MAQLLVRQIEEDVKMRLKERAARHGVSMEEEVRTILREAVQSEKAEQELGLGTRIVNLFKDIPLEDDEPQEPFPWDEIKPAEFD